MVVEKAFAGASAVPGLFLFLSPFNPALLPPVTEQPLFLIPAALATLVFAVGSVFDWRD